MFGSSRHKFTKVYFTDTTEDLAKFVAEAGDDPFGKDVLKREQVE